MNGLVLLLLEAGVALALLVFIVWWTLPRGTRQDGRDVNTHRQEGKKNEDKN